MKHALRIGLVLLWAPGLLPAAAPLRESILLSPPEVLKLDWNTRALSAVDLDGDGLNDLALINNDRAAIELLYQVKAGVPWPAPVRKLATNRWEPVLEDARYRKVRVTTGIAMNDLVVADLNRDGRPDLAYTGDPQALTLRYQEKDGTWTEKKINDAPQPLPFVGSLRAGDLDGDGRQDLVMLGQKEIAAFFQTSTGELSAPDRFALPDDGAYGLELVDVNDDSKLDLVYLSSGSRDGLRVRLQTGQRQFGPEQSFPLKPARSTLQLLARARGREPATFAYAQDQTGHIATFSIERGIEKGDTPLSGRRPLVFAPRTGVKNAASYAVADFDGDGWDDVAIGDPDSAQGLWFRRQPDGGFTSADRFPSLADARGLAAGDWDGDGRADLFVASPKEQTVGVAQLGADGRFGYPQPLPTTGKPLALAAGPLAGDGRTWLVVLRDDQGKRGLDLWTRREGAAVLVQSLEITGTRTDPRAVRLIDIDQDGRLDLAVLTPLDVMRVWKQVEPETEGKLSFKDVSSSAVFRRGLVDNLDSSALTTGDVDGDGKAELLVARTGFSRALKLNAEGQLTVIDQFNARDAGAEVTTTLVVPGKKEALPWLVLYDRKNERLDVLKADAKKVYRVADTVMVGKIDVVGSEVFRNRKTGEPEIFIFGKDRFWWIPLGSDGLRLREGTSYATDLPDIGYSDVIAGDLNGDGRLDLACIDPAQNVLELLSRDADGNWQSRLHFRVFETDEHAMQRKGGGLEPRETLIADVNGDGINDLILLIHDRVLTYFSK